MANGEGTGDATGMTSDLTGDSGMTTEAGLTGSTSTGGESGDTADTGGNPPEVGATGGAATTGGLDESAAGNTLDEAMQNIDTLRGIGGDPGDASTTIR